MHKPFTVYRRPTTRKKRYVYYIQFRDEDGNRMTAVSSSVTNRYTGPLVIGMLTPFTYITNHLLVLL